MLESVYSCLILSKKGQSVKIERAWIEDPLTRGVHEPAALHVRVDAKPDETIPFKEYQASDWTFFVGKDGPFVKYHFECNMTTELSGNFAGLFNKHLAGQLPSIVDIRLHIEDASQHYALPLKRARQLVKKHDPDWRLLLSDKHAEKAGWVLWQPVKSNPVCMFWLGDSNTCGNATVTGKTTVNEIEIPLCTLHARKVQAKFATSRTR